MENRFRKTKPTKSVWLSRKEEREVRRDDDDDRQSGKRRKHGGKLVCESRRPKVRKWKVVRATQPGAESGATECASASEKEEERKESWVFGKKRSLAEEEEVKEERKTFTNTPKRRVCIREFCVRRGRRFFFLFTFVVNRSTEPDSTI